MDREIPEWKKCLLCEQEKEASAFRPNRRMRSGLESYCRDCANMKSAEWRARNPERVRHHESTRVRTTDERWIGRLMREYKLTADQYWELSLSQGGTCAICQESEATKRGLLHVDHDHETGQVRGLLCQRCNVALGHFRERTDLLQTAINYLERTGQ